MAKTEFLDINARRKKVPWWRIFRNSWLPWYAFVTLVTLVILIAVSILFFDLNPYDQQSSEFFKKPNITFSFRDGIGKLILGTDDLGRDVYARLMYGCKNTFLCSFGAATISYIIGMLLGFITSVYSNPVTGSVRYFIRTMNSYTPMIFVFAIQLVSKQTLQGIAERVKGSRMLRGALVSVIGLVVVSLVLLKTGFYTMAVSGEELPMKAIGKAMVGAGKYEYVLPFEFISVFLLACIIGGLVISRKEK